MITLGNFMDEPTPITPAASELFAIGTEAHRISRILDVADFVGWEYRTMQLWRIRKALPGLPVGTVVSRRTLEKHLFPAKPANYGTVEVNGTPQDFAAVESPAITTGWRSLKQVVADTAAETRVEGRTLPEGRVNPHD